MSIWKEAIIDQEVTTAEDARRLADTVLSWLVEEQMIEDRQCDGCVSEGACYPPGPRFMQARGGVNNADSNGTTYAKFSKMAVNGLHVVTTRSAVYIMQGCFEPVGCVGADRKLTQRSSTSAPSGM